MGEPRPTRRAFERATLVLMPLVYGAGFILLALRYLLPLPGRRLPRLDVGPRERFLAGEVARVAFNGRQVFILHDGASLRALDATCTHLSCRVNWVEGERRFRCPCHQGLFAPTGERISGPPDRPLRRQAFEVTPQGRVVLLDREAEA